MNPLVSKNAWLIPMVLFALGLAVLVVFWAALAPETLVPLFDDNGASPVELMTLPLFALIIPLVWLCPPNGGSMRRRAGWATVWTTLSVIAIIRETDLHKALFAKVWPEVASGFKGTVFKMRFLTSPDVPLAPKLFVAVFFAVFFAVALLPLVRFIVPLFRDFFRRKPVAWAMAFFGITTTMVLLVDRMPSHLRKAGHPLSQSTAALFTALEEGGELMMALLALLAVLMSHLHYGLAEER